MSTSIYTPARVRREPRPNAVRFASSAHDAIATEFARDAMNAIGLAPGRSNDFASEIHALQEAAREIADAVDTGVLSKSEADALIKELTARLVERYAQRLAQDIFRGGALPDYVHGRSPETIR